ncbi:Ger(x)C family spore germination C-terminal domain-containing protein [Bacillus sp. FJAT-27251]|uniref:Ger(x)C family spore germination protein n=1 Tax=Bacillus sp. FJAT-27251 TaxID=1684142 RepID=UPI0006A7B0B8|nr:Ger(x)C family spore germination C-terminal domain-containing protein [Bacillus sp. FJAT-27251]
MGHQLKIINIVIMIAALSILPGCWDQTGLDKKVFVIGLGMDKSEESGKIEITYLISNAETGTTQAAGAIQETGIQTITIRASDLISIRNTANAVIAREISYDLLQVIVVSEELAREKDFIRFIYNASKDREIKRNAFLMVSKEKAADFLANNKPTMLTRPHKFYENMMRRGIETGLIPDSQLHHFFRITEEDANLFLGMYVTTEIKMDKEKFRVNENDALAGEMKFEGKTNNAEFLGAAVFLEGQMIGTFSGVENRIVMLINKAFETTDILSVYPDPFMEGYQMAIRLKKLKDSDVHLDLSKQSPKIRVTLPLVAEVMSDPGMKNPAESKEKIDKIRRYLENEIADQVNGVVKKTQEEYKAEPFGWSLYARKEFRTLKEYMAFDWMKTYPRMDVEVDVELRFGEFGRQPKIPTYEGIRD